MLTSYNQIKQEMLDEYDNLTEDAIHEIADSNCPVYYSEIIAEWQHLLSEYCDTWRDHGHEITPETTITNLMAIDLYYYYLELANKAFAEISVEREDLELEEAN